MDALDLITKIEVRDGQMTIARFQDCDPIAEHAKALQNFMHVLREQPGSIDALLGCAETLAHLGRESDAAEKLRRVVEIEPANVHAHHMLGALELRAARFDRAAIEFELVLKLEPERTLVRLDLADAQFRRGRTKDARETMRALIAEGLPDAPDADERFAKRPEHERQRALRSWSAVLARAGALLSALREWEAAAKIIPAFVKMHESEPDAWRALARARYESGDVEGGKEASMRVLALDPRDAAALRGLLRPAGSSARGPGGGGGGGNSLIALMLGVSNPH